ncbi:MAG: HAMP domain-containing sensor histidine kinase [Bacteroidota bacterium]
MKLLNRTILGFLVYSVALLLIVTPVLYFVINGIITASVDETLLHHKREIIERLQHEDISHYEDLDGEIEVKPLEGPPIKEKIYTKHDHRILKGSVVINGKLYSIQARVSLVESEDLISALVITQIVVLFLLVTGMLLINYWNSKTVWKPFYNILGQLKSFQIEKNNPLSLPSTKISEFNDLNVAIEELTKRDRQAFVSQREFTENAAHEMQTPLAVFQSKLDILLQTKPSAEQAPILESLFDATQRLNRLNKGLLLLSKIDNRQFHETEEIDMYLATLRLTKETTITIKGKTLMVWFNPGLLDILLSNLISNSLRYATPGSEIVITITEETWSITNIGQPLTIPQDRIFERFQKGNNNKESLGLGLAIAKKISDTNDLVLTYAFMGAVHRFEIRFPHSKISTKSVR